ncbi:MAG TPA: M14 family zinc carboxypeptidase [Solirubrobacterales bacterium]|nr:M14 family zinc carboxypeptidase [Solirubrobacterales bacterium]
MICPRRCVIVVWAVALTALCAASGPSPAAAAERSVIGHSVQGRPIVALVSGAADAPLKVLVFGDIHGDETAGMRVVRRLLAMAVPPRARLLVVPTINPDGVAAGTRGNAHGVDLNRNFPYRWQPLGGGEYSGPRPLSEPESRAAERLILSFRPDLTIWFHQPFGLVDRPVGNPFAARLYADLSGLPLVRLRRYPGSATRWQGHRLPRSTAFVVELPALVSDALARRAAAAVRTLASQLASPEIGPRNAGA